MNFPRDKWKLYEIGVRRGVFDAINLGQLLVFLMAKCV